MTKLLDLRKLYILCTKFIKKNINFINHINSFKDITCFINVIRWCLKNNYIIGCTFIFTNVVFNLSFLLHLFEHVSDNSSFQNYLAIDN